MSATNEQLEIAERVDDLTKRSEALIVAIDGCLDGLARVDEAIRRAAMAHRRFLQDLEAIAARVAEPR